MQIGFVYSFQSRTAVGPFFRWDSAEDNDALISYANEWSIGSTVDSSSGSPTLNWSDATNPDNSGSINLTPGLLIRCVSQQGFGYVTSELLPTGSWLSDVYGRPFTVNDLLATEVP